jgi:hypothetical protein
MALAEETASRYDEWLQGIGPADADAKQPRAGRKPKGWKSARRTRSAENQAQATLKLANPKRSSSAGLLVDGPLGPGGARPNGGDAGAQRRRPLAEPERRANAQRLFETLSRQANFEGGGGSGATPARPSSHFLPLLPEARVVREGQMTRGVIGSMREVTRAHAAAAFSLSLGASL